MQTLSIPYVVDDAGHEVIAQWRMAQSAAVRTAYANAPGLDERELRDLVKARHMPGPSEPCALDAWSYHCATREGLKLRAQRPDGRMVFGGRKNLERRQKGLITAGDWRALRLRPLISFGDKTREGNRHFRLSPDALTCTVRIYGTSVTLHLPGQVGKRGYLLRAVSSLAAAEDVNLAFSLGSKTLSVTFDPDDLRRLPPGVTLQADDDARLAAKGHRARGRPRGANYVPPPFRWADVQRPVHPEWGPALTALPGRSLGIDLNPGWVGLTVVENTGDNRSLPSTKVLAHRLVWLGLPPDAPREVVVEALSKIASLTMHLCERFGVATVTMEDGLGKLRSGGRGKRGNHKLNAWDRTTLKAMLERRLGLREGVLVTVWAGYSTTIGNAAFALPDACAAAAEIGRRGLAELDWRARTRAMRLANTLPEGGVAKELLPYPCPEVCPSLWKDSGMPNEGVLARLGRAGSWPLFHRIVKAARLGVRRPHPDLASGAESPVPLAVPGFAVSRLGHRRRPGLVLRATPTVKCPVRSGRAAATYSRDRGSIP